MGACLCRCEEEKENREGGGSEDDMAMGNKARSAKSSLLLNPPMIASSAKKKVSENTSVASSSKGVGLGISMMMYQAGMLAGYGPPPNVIDLNNLRAQMRKAKAEGRTVSVLNGCVYIDYQLKAQIPPGFNYDI